MSTTAVHATAVAPTGRGFAHEARACLTVVWRELARVVNHDLGRMLSTALTPLLFLLVLGNGLGGLLDNGDGVALKTFILPGVVAMAVITSAIGAASSFVWDQESGFAREILVAPVRSTSIVLGKSLSGMLIAAVQGSVVVAFCGAADVPYAPLLLVSLFGMMLLTAFTVSSFAVLLAVHTKRMESFHGMTHLAVMPLMFLSGALFPLSELPGWLAVLTRLNPLTYAVDPMRQSVFQHLELSPAAIATYTPGVSWFGWTVPMSLEIVVLAAAGLLFVVMAARHLSRSR